MKTLYTILFGISLAGCAELQTQVASPVNLRPTLEELASLDGASLGTTRTVYDVAKALRTPGRVTKERKLVTPNGDADLGYTEVYLTADTDGDGLPDYFSSTRSGLAQRNPYREVFRRLGDDGKKSGPRCVLRNNTVPDFYGQVKPGSQRDVACKDYIEANVLDPSAKP